MLRAGLDVVILYTVCSTYRAPLSLELDRHEDLCPVVFSSPCSAVFAFRSSWLGLI